MEIRKRCEEIVIVFDVSGSMHGDRLAKAKVALKSWIANSLPYHASIGLVPFEYRAHVGKGFGLKEVNSSSILEIESKIDGLEAGGDTCIGAGLRAAIEHPTLFNNKRGGTILLIGDGIDGCRKPSLESIKKLSIEKQKTVYALNVGLGLDSKIYSLTQETNGKVFDVPDEMNSESLNLLLNEICGSDCNQSKI